MKSITIAFDVDGTLVDSKGRINERIRTLLITLASFKNVKIIVWSGGGELYARQIASKIGVTEYIDAFGDKNHLGLVNGKHVFSPDFVPDIAIDDIQACELGNINLIVREK